MNVIDLTVKERKSLLSYCKERLDERSYIWVRDLINKINYAAINDRCEDMDFLIKCYEFYKGCEKFFRLFLTSKEDGNILLTLYIIGLQLNVKSFKDEIEKSPRFKRVVDMKDWSKVDISVLRDFDTASLIKVIRNNISSNDVLSVEACGIYTISYLNKIGDVNE